MPTAPRTSGSGAANAPGQDFQRTDDTHVAELDDDSFDRDLHDPGLDNAGPNGARHEPRTYSAYDVKTLHAAMPGFTDTELKQIPVLAHGEYLEQGNTYLDLARLSDGPFIAHGGQEAQDPHRYVAKSQVDYVLWNKLTGVDHGGTPSVPSREA